tara:strand:+ start:363 stop:689 length:327 start_codon:yes stop_codon:yes gene_type:complete
VGAELIQPMALILFFQASPQQVVELEVRAVMMAHQVVQVEEEVALLEVAQGEQEQQGREMLAGQDQPPPGLLAVVEAEEQMRLGQMQVPLNLGVMGVTEYQTTLPDQP